MYIKQDYTQSIRVKYTGVIDRQSRPVIISTFLVFRHSTWLHVKESTFSKAFCAASRRRKKPSWRGLVRNLSLRASYVWKSKRASRFNGVDSTPFITRQTLTIGWRRSQRRAASSVCCEDSCVSSSLTYLLAGRGLRTYILHVYMCVHAIAWCRYRSFLTFNVSAIVVAGTPRKCFLSLSCFPRFEDNLPHCRAYFEYNGWHDKERRRRTGCISAYVGFDHCYY